MNPEQTNQYKEISFFDLLSIIILGISPYVTLIIYIFISELFANRWVNVHGKPMEGIGYLFGILPTAFISISIIKVCIWQLKKNHSRLKIILTEHAIPEQEVTKF
jgi:hypothetical protein